MTGLFIAKKVAGPAYIHVIGCQGEPGAKRVQCLHDLEATPRMRGQKPVRVGRQIGVGPLAATPDPAAKLVQLRQPEHVGAMDDHRVRGRDVDTRFNDIGRQQDVGLAVGKLRHHVVELGGRHPAVRGQDPRFRHKSRQTVEDTLQVVDARADTKDLTPAEHLALDRLA